MDPNTGGNSTLRAVSPPRGYVLSGKLMLSGIVVLFGIAISLLLLHLYVRWHVRRRHDRFRRRLNRLIFSSSPGDRNVHPKSAPCGLDKEVLNSLSIEIFSDDDDDDVDLGKCTVCLTEFDEGEKVRALPRCAHRFHVDCIDMWFRSHSTCPLCRCAVEAATSPAPAAEPSFSPSAASAPDSRIREVRIDIPEESGSSTGTEVAPVKLPGQRVISSIRRFFIGELRVESEDRRPSSTPPPPPPPPPPPAAAQ